MRAAAGLHSLEHRVLVEGDFHPSVERPIDSVVVVYQRLGVGATPFLLPLMLQLGFGKTPFETGQIMLFGAVGAVLVKFFIL